MSLFGLDEQRAALPLHDDPLIFWTNHQDTQIAPELVKTVRSP